MPRKKKEEKKEKEVVSPEYRVDVRKSFAEGMKSGAPKWLKKPRSAQSELGYQHRRLKE